jgi:3-hydroxyacyl-CoA dehydrogenase
MTDTKPIHRVAIIGAGVIGASWTALFMAEGLRVVATDIAPNAEAALRKSCYMGQKNSQRFAAGASIRKSRKIGNGGICHKLTI